MHSPLKFKTQLNTKALQCKLYSCHDILLFVKIHRIPKIRPMLLKAVETWRRFFGTPCICTCSGRFVIMWWKFFLSMKWSWSLYFFALNFSGNFSVPHNIWNKIFEDIWNVNSCSVDHRKFALKLFRLCPIWIVRHCTCGHFRTLSASVTL